MEPLSTQWNVEPPARVAAPLRDQALNLVRKAILDFDLKPGQRLIERELMERLSISRPTIREVLALLVSEGLVTVIPQKGAIVSVLTPDEASDIYAMRVSLEALAVRRFVERATDQDREKLRTAYDALALISAEQEPDRLAELNAKDVFYKALFVGAHSPALCQTLSSLQSRVRVLRASSLSVPGRARQAAQELGVVLALIEAGDGEAAGQACAVHITNARDTALARLAQLEPDGKGVRV